MDEEEEDLPACEAMAEKGHEDERIAAGRNREMQIVRTGGRKLFDRERKKVFLEWFAATCNMGWAAEKAGVNYKTVSKHVLKDPLFAADVTEAMQFGVLRLKAKSLETRRQEARIGVEGEIDAPEIEDIDREQAMRLVREHERTLHLGRKPGRQPRVATNAEVRAALVKRLAVFGVRISSGVDTPAGEGGQPVAAQPAPPPCSARSPSPENSGEE